MEKELALLRGIVESVLPGCYRLEEIDVVVGTLYEGQEPSFKVVVRVLQVREDENGESLGWGHELTERIRRFWSRDDLYIEVQERESPELQLQ